MAAQYVEERDGGYFVAGTRISLDSIVHAFRRGEPPETICQNFELLSLEEAYGGAIAYYLAHQPAIDAHPARQNEIWKQARSAAQPLPEALRDKLQRARQDLRSTHPS